METCSGARRGKQKAQHQHQVIEETQLHYPHQQQHHHHHHHHHMHPLQQLQEQQFIQQHQQQQQQQQLQKQPQQQQLMSQKHHHTKPIQAEKYGLSVIMHSGSSTRQNNCSPTPQQAFPHFPPPPTYPPPGITLSGTKQQANASGTLVTPLGVMNMCPGGSADSGNSSSGGGVGTIIPSRRPVHRYPEDLDSIEVCPEQDSLTVKSFRNRSGGSNGSLDGSSGGGNVGGMDSGSSTRSTGSHGKMTVESQAKWPRNNISATMEKFPQSPSVPCGPISMPHAHQDYSYAYYEPGAAMRHSNIPPPEQVAGPSRPPPPNSIRALLSKGKKNKLLVSPSTRQSYQTRYGTQENFYEEIAGEERNAMMIAAGHSLASINQTMMEEEFRRVQNRHRKVLGELNLSVEAMLMPETPPSNSPTEEEPTHQSSDNITELLSTVGPTDELLSPISSSNPAFCGDLDSGFSGSSGASYIGSLRYHKTNAALSNLMTARKSMKSTSGGTHSGNASVTNSSSGGASGTLGTISSFYNSNSCRSSQRSHEDATEHSTALLARASCGRSIAVSSYTKAKSAEDPGPSSATESKARSFWNRKGWRKLPGFSSTSSVHQAGTDEPKLNSGSWEDPLPIASPLTPTQTITTAQLHNPSRRSEPLNSRSSFNGVHNQLILPQHHSKSCNSGNTGSVIQQTGSHKRLEHTPSARTINSSEDSWCSEREHDLSSDDDDVSERSVTSATQRNSQLRSTFNKAKQHLSFDKWRTSGSGGGNPGTQQSPQLQQQTPAISGGSVNSATMPSAQQDSTTPGESPGGRLSRWFSIRRGSTHQYDVGGRDGRNSSSSGSIDATDNAEHISPKSTGSGGNVGNVVPGTKMPQLTENEDDSTRTLDLDLLMPPGSRANGTARPHSRLITPTLPPAPAGLSQQQLKRRHIVAAIVHSENSYVATLQRLVNDYKKPLEESSPPVLSSSKISTLFHRLPEILQCHKIFRIELADCVRNWDRDEKIGDVFVAAFSKPQILEVYSGFINNFSAAMELAKMEAKRKSALADFLKVKQISAHDRLSFFGLMVKPVQRFPQFILFLQDLLKYTPQGHHDRMSLQLALTQLESLAEMLNERKREAEQYQAFKEMLGHISGTFNTRSLTSSSDGSRQRYLLREDNVTQMEFNQSGFIVKSKQRRLLLLNDKVICVSVAPKQSHDFGATEKLSFKWMYPVTDVEIVDNSTSATLSRILTAGVNRGGSLKSNSSSCGNNDSATALTNGADNLCSEMSNLMHDYEVISRINDLVGSLKGHYKELNVDTTRNLLNSIQSSIQKKDEEMAWVDSCCLQLIARSKSGKEETFTFQTENPSVKKEWITALRLAQLALDVNNSPAWEVPEHDQRPSTKMPLFVKAQPVYKSQHQTEVRCGCYYSIQNDNKLGTARRRFKTQNYLWVCTSDGTSSHIAVLSQHHQQSGVLKDVGSFDLIETQVTSMEFIKGITNCTTKDEHSTLLSDLVWMGIDSKKILIYSAANPEQEEQISHCSIPGVPTQIVYYYDSVFVALSNSSLLVYRRAFDGMWMLKDPQVVQLGNSCSVSSILPINNNIYAGCGHRVYVLNAGSGEVHKNFEIQHGNSQQVHLMAHSGIGLWVSLKNSSIICLYHTETFKHLQDINIASSVLRVKSSPKETVNNNSVYVTALIASKGLLWVGTNIGIALTIPLPRLEGVPIISGGVSISCHAHFGAITFLLPLIPKTYMPYKPAIVEQQISNNVIDEVQSQSSKDNTTKKDNNDESVVLRKELDDSLNSSGQESPKRSLDKQNSLDLSLATKLRAQLANSPALRRKRYREMSELSRISKTLPRGLGSANFFSQSMNANAMTLQHNDHGCCDVYGLYGKLIFVKEDYDAEEGGQGNLMDIMYESMRRSDPELAAIPGKVSTLDRRLRMKASRPRSLDLSNWSVDSRSSSLYTSSGSEESMGIRLFGGRSVSRNSSSASHKTSVNGSDLGNISENGTIIADMHSTTLNHDSNKQILLNNFSNQLQNTSTNPTLEKLTANKEQLLSTPVPTSIVTRITPPTIVSNMAAATLKKKNKGSSGKNSTNTNDMGPRTMITLMGGRGYWRHVWYTNSPSTKSSSPSTMSRVANSNDAHIVVWEKKL